MKLSEIASVAGKGGLYKILKPGKSGVILEALDDSKKRIVMPMSQKISILDEISIYTLTKEGTTPLLEVLQKIKKDFGDDLGIDSESDSSELHAFLKSVLPEYDETRVYTSDIKKLVKWYEVLRTVAPEIFESSDEGSTEAA